MLGLGQVLFIISKSLRKLNIFYLELSKVQQTGQLEGAPLVEIDPRAEEVEGERCRHGTEELEEEY